MKLHCRTKMPHSILQHKCKYFWNVIWTYLFIIIEHFLASLYSSTSFVYLYAKESPKAISSFYNAIKTVECITKYLPISCNWDTHFPPHRSWSLSAKTEVYILQIFEKQYRKWKIISILKKLCILVITQWSRKPELPYQFTDISSNLA